MKKHFILSAAFLMAATGVCAQQEAGTWTITPKVGVTVSNFSGKMPAGVAYAVLPQMPADGSPGLIIVTGDETTKAGVVGFDDSKQKFGFAVGAEAQYQFTDVFGLSFGAFYTQQGAKYDTKGFPYTSSDGVKVDFNDDLKIKLNSITVPILANVYVWKGLAVKAGLQPEFAVSKKTSGDVTISYKDQSASVASNTDAGIKTFSLSVPVGVSYEYRNIVADLRYHFGVTDLRKGGDTGWGSGSSSKSENRTLLFTVGYKFGL